MNGEAVNGNEFPFWNTLLRQIREGQVIPVVGEGLLSAPYNGRQRLLYSVLAEKLVENLGVEPDWLPQSGELNTAVCCCLDAGRDLEDEIYPALLPRGERIFEYATGNAPGRKRTLRGTTQAASRDSLLA